MASIFRRPFVSPPIHKSWGHNTIPSTLFLARCRRNLPPSISASLSRPALQSHRPFTSFQPLGIRYVRFPPSPPPGALPPPPYPTPEGDQRQKRRRHAPSPRAARIIFIVVCLGSIYYVVHLEQVPETGRWRFIDISPRQEAAIAEEAYKQLVKEYGVHALPPSHPLTRYVQRVAGQILESNNLGTLRGAGLRTPTSARAVFSGTAGDNWDWDSESHGTAPGTGQREWNLLVVDDPKMVNAMAVPGTIIVFTGILPICQNEEGLAAVLGHEIGHVVARHSAERYSVAKILLGVTLVFQTFIDNLGVSGLLTSLLFELPNSRKQELEADTIGIRLTARACYDPRGAPEMFARLARAEGSSGFDFIRTHPSSDRRVARLIEQLPQAYAIRAESAECAGLADQFSAFKRW